MKQNNYRDESPRIPEAFVDWLNAVKLLLQPGRCVFSDCDEYGEIHVFDRGDERYLIFEQPYEQSGLYKSDPSRLLHEYTQAMMLAMVYRQQPRHITLLGLGGGSLARCLYAYDSSLHIQAVELRAKVVETAYRYFQLPDDERLQVVVMDAGNYLRQAATASTQLIFSDIYRPLVIDPQQLDDEFIQHCHRILDSQGWLVLNYFSTDRYLVKKWDALYALFPVVRSCTVNSGNLLVFAGKCDSEMCKQLRLQQVELLSKMLRIPLIRYKLRLQ
jgi:spermidine synthase